MSHQIPEAKIWEKYGRKTFELEILYEQNGELKKECEEQRLKVAELEAKLAEKGEK